MTPSPCSFKHLYAGSKDLFGYSGSRRLSAQQAERSEYIHFLDDW
jgi:hypothetical protein